MNISLLRGVRGQLSRRDQRTLLIGTSCVVGLIALFRGLPAWRTWTRDTRASAIALSNQLTSAQQMVAHAGSIQRMSDTLEERYLSVVPAFITGATPAQAGATLATYVTDAANMAGVQLGMVQLLVDSADTARGATSQDLYRIRVTAQARGDVRGITGLLSAFERSATPLLTIRTLSISQADPAAPSNRPEELQITFEIEGLAHRDTDP